MKRLIFLIVFGIVLGIGAIYAQSGTQSKLLPIASSEVLNFNDPAGPVLQLPYDPGIANPLHNETDIINAICFQPGVSSDNDPNTDLYYVGQHPAYCQAIVHDRNGNILFQIVDNNIYNRFGESFVNTQGSLYAEAHYWLHQGEPNLYDNSYNISTSDYESNCIGEYLNRAYCTDPTQYNPENRIVLTPEVVVVPVPEATECNEFYIIYGTHTCKQDPNAFVDINIYYRRLTITDHHTISMTPPTLLTSKNGSANSRIGLAITEYRPDQQDYMLFVDRTEEIVVFRVNANAIETNTSKIIGYGWLILGSSGMNRCELEVIKRDQTYLLSVAASGQYPNYSIIRFPYEFSSIIGFTSGYGEPNSYFSSSPYYSQNSWFVSISGITGCPKGIEFTENGDIVYFTFENQDNIYYCDLDNYFNMSTPPASPPVSQLQIANANYYENSHIEIGRNGNLYFQGDDGSTEYLAWLTDPGSPLATNWNFSQLDLYTQYDFTGTPFVNQKVYIFMDQIDGSEYYNIATADPASKCCYIYDEWPVNLAPGIHTWAPGIGNNPFNSIDGTVILPHLGGNYRIDIYNNRRIDISGMTFMMDKDLQIWLFPGLLPIKGARLQLFNNTTFTSREGCDELWGGIFLRGAAGAPLGIYYFNTTQPVLKVYSNSMIENATTGVESMNGGIILTENAIFKNNGTAVYIHEYTDPATPDENLCRFWLTDFYTDRELNEGEIPFSHAHLDRVTSIEFKACNFWNSRIVILDVELRGMGIYGRDAGFQVISACPNSGLPAGSPCPPQFVVPSTFEKLYYGIKSQTTVSYPVKVDTANFITNHRGLYLSGYNNSQITRNDFKVDMLGADQVVIPPGAEYCDAIYGAYLNECSGYVISYNTFHDGWVGMFVNNSGQEFNEVFHNEFINLNNNLKGGGIIVLNENSNYHTQGLVITCNKFFYNSYHISVIEGTIQPVQAHDPTNLNINWEPADNIFMPDNPGGEREFYFLSTPGFGTNYYEWTNDPGMTWHTELIAYTISNITKTQFPWNISTLPWDERCVQLTSTSTKMDTLGIVDFKIDSLSTALSDLVDNGNTELLTTQVLTATTGTKEEIKDDLLQTAPYTSDEVFNELIEENTTFTSFDKSEVLIGNSPLPTNILEEVELSSISESHRNIIGQYQTGISDRVQLENRKNRLTNKRSEIYNSLIRKYSLNDSLPGNNDSLEILYSQANSIELRLQALDYLCSQQDYTEALSRITNFSSEFNGLSPERQMELSNYLSLMEIVVGYQQATNDSLKQAIVQNNFSFLNSLAYSNHKGNSKAQLLLEEGGLDAFDELIMLQEDTANKSLAVQNQGSIKFPNITDCEVVIYPNPAKETITIDYAILNYKGEKIRIFDVKGIEIMSIPMTKPVASLQVNVAQLKAGNYLVKVGEKYSEKITILK